VLHVPLIIHHPGYDNLAGSRMQQIVQRIDLMPTILEIAGVKAPELELQGMSLMPLFENPNAQWRQYGFARNKRNLARLFDLNIDERIVRDDCYKLHHYLYKENYELYNICDDPMETHNLAVEKPDVVTRLSFELLKNMETSRPHQPGLPSGGLKLKAQAFQRSAPAGPIAASQGGGK
jgi:N-acetylglucosamine-6-sulfatase